MRLMAVLDMRATKCILYNCLVDKKTSLLLTNGKSFIFALTRPVLKMFQEFGIELLPGFSYATYIDGCRGVCAVRGIQGPWTRVPTRVVRL